MKIFRKQEGFTLVELLIAIMTGSIVTLAAVTVLLLGLRLNNTSSGTATRQNNARILLSVLESMAAEGDIQYVGFQNTNQAYNDWVISRGVDDEGDPVDILFSYSQANRIVYTGDGTPLIEDIRSSYVDLDGNLLTVSITTADGTYMSSIYCRMIPKQENLFADRDEDTAGKTESIVGNLTDDKPSNDGIKDETVNNDTAPARAEFLKVLLSQYQLKDGRANHGVILENGYSTGEYYTEWFIYGYGPENPGWNEGTPWCACYVSWCINEIEGTWIADENNPEYHREPKKRYAHWYDNVDVFMKEYFQKGDDYGTERKPEWYWSVESYDPIPGDLIFFDWTMDTEKWIRWVAGKESQYAPNPSHVGVVIHVDEATNDVYTIEGNTGGRVAIRKYPITDPNIIGYGVMPWKTS